MEKLDKPASIEERIAKIEGILEQISLRLNHVETNQRWTLGILVTMWVTIILAILFKVG
jgi:hypothetical protein